MACIRTYSGRMIDLRSPSASDISAVDIVTSLSRQNRYLGHTRHPLTVAQHVVLCSRAEGCWCNRDERRWALAHDFHEAYLGDLCRPMLQTLGAISASVIEAIEDLKVSLDLAVAARFGLNVTHEIEQRVSVIDDLILKVEMQSLGLATKTSPGMRDGGIVFPWNGQVWEPAHCVRELYLEMARLEMI